MQRQQDKLSSFIQSLANATGCARKGPCKSLVVVSIHIILQKVVHCLALNLMAQPLNVLINHSAFLMFSKKVS